VKSVRGLSDVRCGLCWSGVAVLREGPVHFVKHFHKKNLHTPLSTELRDDIIMNGLIFGLRNARSNICEKLTLFSLLASYIHFTMASETRIESTFWCTALEVSSNKDLFGAAEL